jgi:hypothetical protein
MTRVTQSLLSAGKRWVRRTLRDQGLILGRRERIPVRGLEDWLQARRRRKPPLRELILLDPDPTTLRCAAGAAGPVAMRAWARVQGETGTLFAAPHCLGLAHARSLRALGAAERRRLLAEAEEWILVLGTGPRFSPDWFEVAALFEEAGLQPLEWLQEARCVHGSSQPDPAKIHFGRMPDGAGKPASGLTRAASWLSRPVIDPATDETTLMRGWELGVTGVLNPGCFHHRGRIHLLARREEFPWAVQKRDPARFFSPPAPLLVSGPAAGDVGAAGDWSPAALHWAAAYPAGSRAEDFRIFEHAGEWLSNHALIFPGAGAKNEIRPEQLLTRVGVSRLDPVGRSLRYLGLAQLPIPLRQVEKNWAMFSAAGEINLLYSFQPYRLFACAATADLRFLPRVEARLDLPAQFGETALRNSINPVDYDEHHLLHVVHAVYPDKQYVFWATLLDRRSRLPVRISRRPLLRGESSLKYLCSALAGPEILTFFGGLEDSAVACWTLPRARLDAEWLPVSAARATPSSP